MKRIEIEKYKKYRIIYPGSYKGKIAEARGVDDIDLTSPLSTSFIFDPPDLEIQIIKHFSIMNSAHCNYHLIASKRALFQY